MNEYGSRETPFPSIDHKEKILYKGLTVHSEYITMRDGVEIAVSYCLPKGMDSGTRIPAALFQTRYWRTRRIRAPLGWFVNEVFGNRPVPQVLTSRGYATIHVDVRGTGASTGHRPEGPFSKAEIEDGREIIDWIVRQPWSNGEVIPLGVSYVGSTSEFCAALGHSATRACMPLHSFWDAYTDVVFPGGVYDQRFMQMWSFFGRSLDLNSSHAFKEVRPLYYYLLRSVTPVNSDPDEIKLRAVVEEHAQNQYVDDLTQDYDYSDDTTPEGLDLASRSLYPYANSLGRTGIPIYTICSWYDSGYGEAVINKFLNLENPMIAILGDWNHGAAEPVKIGRRRPKRINRDLKDIKHHWHHHADFFDTCLRGDGIQGKTLFYYTVGQEEWKRTEVWPPSGETVRWFFGPQNSLQSFASEEESASDEYEVDFEATTGENNRWWTLLGQSVDYSKRSEQDKRLQVYESPPLTERTEITGHPVATLNMTSTHEDGAVFAYLEEVDAAGSVSYITDGQLRLIHRKISPEEPPYKTVGPSRTYSRADSEPVRPGEVMQVVFKLYPISYLVPKGHRLRIALAGADKDTFKRYPSEGTPVLTFLRNRTHMSYIDLPIVR